MMTIMLLYADSLVTADITQIAVAVKQTTIQ